MLKVSEVLFVSTVFTLAVVLLAEKSIYWAFGLIAWTISVTYFGREKNA